jgi:hypothetical protein
LAEAALPIARLASWRPAARIRCTGLSLLYRIGNG